MGYKGLWVLDTTWTLVYSFTVFAASFSISTNDTIDIFLISQRWFSFANPINII